jgi:hypothetical protein
MGVPHGGKWGDVRWFEREAAREGMFIAWSTHLKCFVIYTKDGANVVSQMNCQKEILGDPIPLSRSLLGRLVGLRRDHYYRAKGSLQEMVRQSEIDVKRRHQEEVRREMDEMRHELHRETDIALGRKERRIYVGA